MPISTSEKIGLIDTNVLVYRADQDSTFHLPSVNLISRGLRGDISLCLGTAKFNRILCGNDQSQARYKSN